MQACRQNCCAADPTSGRQKWNSWQQDLNEARGRPLFPEHFLSSRLEFLHTGIRVQCTRLCVLRCQRPSLNASLEVVNQLAQIKNYSRNFDLKSQQVQALYDSISIAGQLFNNARADYTEVLFTQRDALESKLELIELKQQQLGAFVKAYKALGGGYNRDDGGSGTSARMDVPKAAGILRGAS